METHAGFAGNTWVTEAALFGQVNSGQLVDRVWGPQRASPFHGDNAGSNPAGDAILFRS